MAVAGNGGGAGRFARVGPFLAPDVRFHGVTLPGFAGEPGDPSLRAVRDYAERLLPVVEGASRPRVVLGTGIGGSFLLDLLQRHAGAVDGLILHAPVGTRLDTRLFPRLMKVPGVRPLGKRILSSRLTRPVMSRLLFRRPLPREVRDRFFNDYRRTTAFSQMFDIFTAAWFATLRPIDVPAALLWGESERMLSIDQLDDYKALLPRCVVRRVPGWDHFPMLEEPEAYAGEVTALARTLVAGPVPA